MAPVRRPNLSLPQESLCAKVRVIDDPDRLIERLGEIDPTVYRNLVTDLGLPPSCIADLSEQEAATRDLVLAAALFVDGCVVPRCKTSEVDVMFVMFGPDGEALPGGFCGRHVPTRTRLRKLGVFLAYTGRAGLPVLAGMMVTELVAGVGVRRIPLETLRRLALRRATVHDLTPEDIARLEVNFIRHELTKYDAHLNRGLDLDDTRQYTYQAISFVYPHLAGECARQYSQKTNGLDLEPLIPGLEPTPS
ncbi:MAG: hypothetical protein LC792_17335 [Actinobacteria bacterium]|nr:hypothetical protein [Actinomycetota bacterium]